MDGLPAYWHGGVSGLRSGGYLLPPASTGVPSPWARALEDCGLEVPRPDRVYLATLLRVAQLWAVCHPAGGWLYRVLPEGALEADPNPEIDPGVSWQCERARIVEVLKLDAGTLARLRTQMLAGPGKELAQ